MDALSQMLHSLRVGPMLLWVSVVMFFGTLAVVPLIVARIPADYFLKKRGEASPFRAQHPVGALALRVVKNLTGGILLVAGVVMLVLPGQGILTILIGIMLIDFPGKRRFELALISRPRVLCAVNWMRRRAGREDLLVERDSDD